MSDIYSIEKRKQIMSRIHGKDTKIELIVRRWLYSFGYRYRLHDKRYPGTPDIVLPKYKTVIFIHGCFWHLHKNCKRSDLPKTRTDFWAEKLNCNVQRDSENIRKLELDGWNVIVIWECELKGNTGDRLIKLLEEIRGSE